jgi:hypothetical protein
LDRAREGCLQTPQTPQTPQILCFALAKETGDNIQEDFREEKMCAWRRTKESWGVGKHASR